MGSNKRPKRPRKKKGSASTTRLFSSSASSPADEDSPAGHDEADSLTLPAASSSDEDSPDVHDEADSPTLPAATVSSSSPSTPAISGDQPPSPRVLKDGGEAMVSTGHYQYLPSFDRLQNQCLKFLYEYLKKGEVHPYYRALVLSLSKRRCYKLEINVNHLKSSLFTKKEGKEEIDEEYWELIVKIVNHSDQTRGHLQPVISYFLKNEGFESDEETIKKKAEVHFINKPQSIVRLQDFLHGKEVKREILLRSNEETIETSTTDARRTFMAVLVEILSKHRKNESYGGAYEIANIVIINSDSCWILMTPSLNSKPGRMASDLKKLWNIMEPYYKNNQGYLPLYFPQLEKDLQQAYKKVASEESFRRYLECHPALKSSMARRTLILGLNRYFQDFWLSADPNIKKIFSISPYHPKDWREIVKNGSKTMKSVYFFNHRLEPFYNTYKELLRYMRNFLVHAKGNNNVHETIDENDENELFASSKFSRLLPDLLRKLLCADEKDKKLEQLLSRYQDSV